MAGGRAAVVGRVGQLESLIQHEVTGLLCPPGDAVALAAALERLRCEPELRSRLGRAARACVLPSHTWEALADRVLQLASGGGRGAPAPPGGVGGGGARAPPRLPP